MIAPGMVVAIARYGSGGSVNGRPKYDHPVRPYFVRIGDPYPYPMGFPHWYATDVETGAGMAVSERDVAWVVDAQTVLSLPGCDGVK